MDDSSKRRRSQTLIFTDLDGTLLDEKTYDFKPALPALRLIHSLEIPLILASSKTRAEIESLRKRLSLDTPFITENGGGVFFPAAFTLPQDYSYEELDGYNALLVGRPIKEVLEKSRKLKQHFDFKGFSEMHVKEIAAITGLNTEEAVLASRREFDEPIVLEDPLDDGEIFCREASDLGLDCVHGGRFIHLSLGSDKGKAVQLVLRIYEQLGGPIFSIALGDSPNDISMLKVVDKAVLMQDKGGIHTKDLIHPDLMGVEEGGPEAWNGVILSVLSA